jgi:uncharacterized tellurite resistance protein B-like protein
MDLLNIFKTDNDGIRKSHIKNLLAVALADGHMASDEWELLITISRVMGFSEEKILSIRQNPEQIKFILPKKYDEKVQQIQDLVAIMTIDGNINEKELDLCKKISLKLDILPQLVDDIIYDIFHPNPATGSSTSSHD